MNRAKLLTKKITSETLPGHFGCNTFWKWPIYKNNDMKKPKLSCIMNETGFSNGTPSVFIFTGIPKSKTNTIPNSRTNAKGGRHSNVPKEGTAVSVGFTVQLTQPLPQGYKKGEV